MEPLTTFFKVNMSVSKAPETFGLGEFREWLESLGLSLDAEEESPLQRQLGDGVLLCQLVNKIKPRSVENVSIFRRFHCGGEGSAEAWCYLATTLTHPLCYHAIDFYLNGLLSAALSTVSLQKL